MPDLRPFGLTFARYEVLMLLSFSTKGSLPLGKIGERLQVNAASVTNAVDRLEAQGLVVATAQPRATAGHPGRAHGQGPAGWPQRATGRHERPCLLRPGRWTRQRSTPCSMPWATCAGRRGTST